MKKTLSIILALAMTLSLLAGCSESTTADTSDTSSTAATTTTTTTTTATDSGSSDEGATTTEAGGEPEGTVAGSVLSCYFPMDVTTQTLPGQVSSALWLYPLMYDQLMYTPDGTYDTIEGLLVKDWTSSDDACEWVLNLHEDVCYANGNNMTAAHVIRCFEILEGNGASTFSSMQSYEATGEYQITITYATSRPEFLYELANGHCGMFDPTAIDEAGGVVSNETLYMAGTGPYYLSDYASGNYMTFTANPNYWNEDRTPHIETLDCKIILDQNTQVTALLSGECSYGLVENYSNYETILSSDSLISTEFYGQPRAVYMNASSGILSNIRVREALSMLVDPDQLAAAATGGFGYALDSAFSGVSLTYTHSRVYDPEGGLAILEEEGIDPASIVLYPMVDSSVSPLYYNLQAQLAEYGITLEFSVRDNPAVLSDLWAGNWDLSSCSGGLNNISYSTSIFDMFGEGGIHHLCRDENIEAEAAGLVRTALTSANREEEMENIDKLLELLDVNYAYLAAVQVPEWHITAANVQNTVYDQVCGDWMPWEWWLA